MNRRMDGRMDEWIEGWKEGGMNGWVGGWVLRKLPLHNLTTGLGRLRLGEGDLASL